MRTPDMIRGRRSSAPARWATSSPGSRTSAGARSGETVTETARPADAALEGYLDPKPMVFCGIYPIDGDDLPRPARRARQAAAQRRVDHLRARDEPRAGLRLPLRVPGAVAHGDRARAPRARVRPRSSPPRRRSPTGPSSPTAPRCEVDNPTDLPDPSRLDHIDEPMLEITILTPVGVPRRGDGPRARAAAAEMSKMEYLSTERVELRYTIPLAEVVIDFFDALKSRTKGYASLDYEPSGYITSPARARRPAHQPRAGRRVLDHRAPRPTPTPTGGGWPSGCASSSRARCSTCRSRPPSAVGSSRARPSRPAARTSSPSATAATSRASASSSRSRRRARRR